MLEQEQEQAQEQEQGQAQEQALELVQAASLVVVVVVVVAAVGLGQSHSAPTLWHRQAPVTLSSPCGSDAVDTTWWSRPWRQARMHAVEQHP